MSRMISLDGVTDAFDSFKGQVKGVDVGVGYLAGSIGGKVVGAKLNQWVLSKIPGLPAFFQRPDVVDLLGATVVGLGLFVAQKGNARAKGHFVGAVGGAAVQVLATQLAAVLPLSAYVSYNGHGMGILTQDNAFGILTQDNAFGGLTYEEPTESELSAFADFSHNYLNDAVEDAY